MTKTTYNEIQDLMASIVTLNADAYHKYLKKELSEEKLQQIVNITNIYIKRCEDVFRGKYD